MSNEMSNQFDVKLAVKRVAYFQTVCPDFIIVLYCNVSNKENRTKFPKIKRAFRLFLN